MRITTSRGNIYSYRPQNNQIIAGETSENKVEWTFTPLNFHNKFSDVQMFIIAVTEKCNLRCRYCCYSGEYSGKRTHGSTSIKNKDIYALINFIDKYSIPKTKRIAFYGGEPLLNFSFIKEFFKECKSKWKDEVLFSISTNGTLLNSENIDWLISNGFEIAISIDGDKNYHDRNRIDILDKGSFELIFHKLNYIFDKYVNPNVSLHVTLENVTDIIGVAESWYGNPLLRKISPATVHGLTPNFNLGVPALQYREVKLFYEKLIDNYQLNPEWIILKVFLEEIISALKERIIFEIDEPIGISTCLPHNTKLYIDTKLEIGVCEKFSDDYRIGNIYTGINWKKTNELIEKYYHIKMKRCSQCPIMRICEMCLTAVEFTPKQWDVLCHNEKIYFQAALYAFCEMAERGLIK